jgi:hypothetical protein
MPADLKDQPIRSCPRVLPKLAVLRSRTAQAVTRPSEVDGRRQKIAITERSTCRSEGV